MTELLKDAATEKVYTVEGQVNLMLSWPLEWFTDREKLIAAGQHFYSIGLAQERELRERDVKKYLQENRELGVCLDARTGQLDALKEKCERYEAALDEIIAIRNGANIDGALGKRTEMWRVANKALATPIGRDGGKGN